MARERVQRRLAAILAADVVGYSRLMGHDEAGTLSRLRAHRRELINPTIRAHGGRVVRLAGDGALVEFPSAVEAVTSAVVIQRGMIDRNDGLPESRKIVFRIAINLGDLIIEEDDIYGDGVNVAARLETLAPPGGVLISRSVRDQIRDKLPFTFDDQGEHEVKNIARPVRIYVLGPDAIASLPHAHTLGATARAPPPRLAITATTAAIAIAIGASAWLLMDAPSSDPSPTDLWPIDLGQPTSISAPIEQPARRLSLVVMPFANAGDHEHDYLADGITEDLTADVGRLPGLLVTARHTAFTYKGRPADLKQVGRDLDVRYALEGSVRRAGDSVRVDAQLVDTATGLSLWSERFDVKRGHMAELRGQVTARVARSLGADLPSTDPRRSRDRPAPPEAEDLMFRGLAFLNRVPSRETMAEARRLLEQAVDRDPGSADAKAFLAQTYLYDGLFRWAADREVTLAAAERHARAALEIEPRHVCAHWVQGTVHDQRRQFDRAIESFDAAIAANPSFAQAYARRGQSKLLTGRPQEAITDVEQALRLSPRDPNLAVWHWYLGFAALMLNRPDEALQQFAHSVEVNSRAHFFYPHLASAYVLSGRVAEGRSTVADYVKLRPGASIEGLRRDWNLSDHAAYMAVRNRQLEALRQAGLPEH